MQKITSKAVDWLRIFNIDFHIWIDMKTFKICFIARKLGWFLGLSFYSFLKIVIKLETYIQKVYIKHSVRGAPFHLNRFT